MKQKNENGCQTLNLGIKSQTNIIIPGEGGSYYQIYTVKKITPTGKIRLNNGILLNSNGRYYPRDVWDSNSYDIEPVTDEILEAIRIRKLKIKLSSNIESIFKDYNLMGMSVDDLETINNILEKYINKEEG